MRYLQYRHHDRRSFTSKTTIRFRRDVRGLRTVIAAVVYVTRETFTQLTKSSIRSVSDSARLVTGFSVLKNWCGDCFGFEHFRSSKSLVHREKRSFTPTRSFYRIEVEYFVVGETKTFRTPEYFKSKQSPHRSPRDKPNGVPRANDRRAGGICRLFFGCSPTSEITYPKFLPKDSWFSRKKTWKQS